MNPMILGILYIWCQFNKDQIVQFWFGTQFKVLQGFSFFLCDYYCSCGVITYIIECG